MMSITSRMTRLLGLAAASAVATALVGQAQAEIRYGDTITIHESVTVDDNPAAIWARFGTFCALTTWVGPVTSCVYDEGIGQQGTIRRIEVDGLGELREVMSVQAPHLYTYEVLGDGTLAQAKYRSTISAVPGTKAGTAEVHWRTTMESAAFEDGGAGMAKALEGIYRASLETLKKMAE